MELDAPDYAALVIEWNDVGARDADQTLPMRMPYLTPEAHHTIATLVGALGALVLATWGLYRLGTSPGSARRVHLRLS